jgi:hypothetical protein
MTSSGLRNPHEREAARLRSLLSVATTPALRARLLQQVQEQERLAQELEELRASFVEAEA